MRTRLKVCCITSVHEAALAVRLGADAIGLVGKMPSGPGPIDDDLIAEIARTIPPEVAAFLLTSRTDPDAIVEHVLAAGVNTVQLVDEVPDRAYAALRRGAPSVRIVQVLHVEGERVLEQAGRIGPLVDAILLDSGRPCAPIGGVRELGGTGRTHDWTLSARVVAGAACPVFLAGGLRPENVGEAIRTVRPFGIDACTGLRSNGALDESKVRAMLGAIRSADGMDDSGPPF